MDNNQLPQRPTQQPESEQPFLPVAPAKKNRKPLIITLIIVALLAVVGIGLLVAHLLGDSKSSSSTDSADSLATGAAFMDNNYAKGARVLEVDGEADVLGLSEDGTRLSVWRSAEGDRSAELAIYDAASLDVVAETEVTSCTAWYQDDLLLCASPVEVGETPVLQLYSMKDATLNSDAVIYEHPFMNDQADVSQLGSLDFLGETDGNSVFVVNVSNSYLDPSKMTEDEAARATNMLGLYSVDYYMLVALGDDNSQIWSHEISVNDTCGLIEDGGVIACLDLPEIAVDGETTIRILNTTDGEVMTERTTPDNVIMASDGWIEAGVIGEIDVNASLGDLMKGVPVVTYDFNGNKKSETESAAGGSIVDIVPAPVWLPDNNKVVYPAKQIIENVGKGSILAANGKAVAKVEVSQSGVMGVARAGGGSIADGSVQYVSADGKTLLVVKDSLGMSTGDFSFNDSPDSVLVDVDSGEEIQTLTDGNLMLSSLNHGIFAVQTIGDGTASGGLAIKTFVFVPVAS